MTHFTTSPEGEAWTRAMERMLAKCLSQGRSPTTTDVLAVAVDFMDSTNTILRHRRIAQSAASKGNLMGRITARLSPSLMGLVKMGWNGGAL